MKGGLKIVIYLVNCICFKKNCFFWNSRFQFRVVLLFLFVQKFGSLWSFVFFNRSRAIKSGFRIPFEGPVRDLRKWAQRNRNQVIGDISSLIYMVFISPVTYPSIFGHGNRGYFFLHLWRLGPGHLVQLVYDFFKKSAGQHWKAQKKTKYIHPWRLTAGTSFPGGLVQIMTSFLSFHAWFVGEPAVNLPGV